MLNDTLRNLCAESEDEYSVESVESRGGGWQVQRGEVD